MKSTLSATSSSKSRATVSPPPDMNPFDARFDKPGELSRRGFIQSLGAGLLLAAWAPAVLAQQRRRGPQPIPLDARIHIGEDGVVTVMTGKVEMGQGARAQLTAAAAEELRLPVEQIRLIMGDTSLCPDDGGTCGSQTTPRTVPAVRSACATAYGLLVALRESAGDENLTYADLASRDDGSALRQNVPEEVEVTRVEQWTVMGS